MNKKYIITDLNNTRYGFLLTDGKVQEIRPYDEESILGNIYVGRVSNIVKNINAAFVDIKKGYSCYYPMEELGSRKLKVGDILTVQINKEPIKTKQPSVTTKLNLNGDFVVVHEDSVIGVSNKIKDDKKRNELKEIISKAIEDFKKIKKSNIENFGAIVRTRAENVSEEVVYNETIKLLCELDSIIYKSVYATAYSCMYQKCPAYIQDIQELSKQGDINIVTDIDDILDICKKYNVCEPDLHKDDNISIKSLYNLNTSIEKALNSRVYLKSGAYLIIEYTEAMTVIDVNTGKAIKGSCKEDKILNINTEAAREIARQLRIRNISGIIIIDFINMENSANNEMLLKYLKEMVYDDSVPTTVVDMTKLGLVEITRKRIRKPLHEIIKNTEKLR